MKALSLLLLLLSLTGSAAAQRVRRFSPKFSPATLAVHDSRRLPADTLLNAYLTLRNDASIAQLQERHGVHFNLALGNIHTVLVPRRSLAALERDETVERIDLAPEAQPMTDRAAVLTRADILQQGTDLPTSYRGKGVLVGVIDTGFDYTHPNFRDPSGNCRILTAWNQNLPSDGNTYGYGRILSPSQLASLRHDQTRETHGTHVAGIAAGSHPLYRGIAPEADLLLVTTNKTEQGIVEGIDFLIRQAESRRRPISINLSFGTILGYKDGSGTLARLIDSLVADRRGVLLSIAVGNEGHRPSTLQGSHSLKSYLQPPAYGRDQLFFQGERGKHYSLRLVLADTVAHTTLLDKTFAVGTAENQTLTQFGTDDKANASLTVGAELHPLTGCPSLRLHLSYAKRTSEAWSVHIDCNEARFLLNSDYGTFSDLHQPGYTSGTTASTLAATATGHAPIAVGAYVSRTNYVNLAGQLCQQPWVEADRYPLSGVGPTFDDRLKPDIVAPGAAVVSSFSSFAQPYAASPADKVLQTIDPDGKIYTWGVQSGTSMATPVVAGILALWLEAHPQLTLAQARRLLTARPADSFTGALPNPRFGRGKIDALAGLKALLSTVGLATPTPDPSPRYLYDRATHTLHLRHTETAMLLTLAGTPLLTAASGTLSLTDLPAGVYLLRLTDAQGRTCCHKIAR